MEVLLQHEIVGHERGVELGKLPQGGDARFHHEREQGHLDPCLLVLLVELDAQRLQIGDVRLVELRDVRDHHPVAGEIRARDLLDARERLHLHRAELGEIHLRPRQEVERAAEGRRAGGGRRLRGHRLLHVALHVRLQDPPFRPGAGHPRQIHSQLARELAHRGRGVRLLERLALDRGRGHCGWRRLARSGRRPGGLGGCGCRRGGPSGCRGGGPGGSGSGSAGGGLRGHRRGGRRCGCGCRCRLSIAACRRGCGRRGLLPVTARGGVEDEDDLALADPVAHLHLEILDRAGRGRRHVHRRLVGLDLDQRILGFDRVPGLDENLDDRHVLEIADCGDLDFERAHRSLPRHTVHGAGRSAATPYFWMASATFAAGRTPSSANALSAAIVTWNRSTSKNRRSFSRVSDRP